MAGCTRGREAPKPHPCCDLKNDRPSFPLTFHVPMPLPSGTENAWLRGSKLLLTQLVCILGQLATGKGERFRGVPQLSTQRYDFQGTSGCKGTGFGHFSFKISTICSRMLVSLLNPFPLLRASLIYGISSENNVQKSVCHVGCAKAINPDSFLVSLKGFWEPNIRHPSENVHQLSFSMCCLALFIYFYDDDDWKIKVTRQKSLMDTPTAAPCPGNCLTFVVE